MCTLRRRGQYKGRVFKIPHLMGWHVLVSTPELIEELRRAPDEVLSFEHAVGEVCHTLYPSFPFSLMDRFDSLYKLNTRWARPLRTTNIT